MTHKKKLLCRAITLAPLLTLLPLGANALTMKEVERRLQAYEARIQQLEQQLAEKNQQTAAATTAESSKVVALESQVKSLRSEVETDKEKFKINGFMSAGVTTHDQDGLGYADIDGDEIDTQATNKVGIQMAYRVNEKTEAQVQILAKGVEDYDADIAWAFLKYDITPDMTVRAGRLRTPFFMMSEYLDVGYAYPWVRPPQEMYGLTEGLDAYEGFDLAYTLATGDLINRFMIYGGRVSETAGDNDTTVDNVMGTRVSSTIGNWTLGAGYARGKLNAEITGLDDLNAQLESGADFSPIPVPGISPAAPLLEEDNAANFAGLGVTYDDGDWLFMAEHGRVRVSNLYPDTEGHFVTLAKRFDKFQPYINYGHSYTIDDGDRNDAVNAYYGAANNLLPFAGFLPDGTIDGLNTVGDQLSIRNTAQRSMTYGVRYDLMDGIDLKLEYQHIYDLENGGLFTGFDDPNDEIGNADITTISIDAVF